MLHCVCMEKRPVNKGVSIEDEIRRENRGKAKLSERNQVPEHHRASGEVPEQLMEALQEFWDSKEELYDRALAMYYKVREEGLSYRFFGVGAAALVLDRKTGKTKIWSGYNEKYLYSNGDGTSEKSQKHCAELKIVNRAKELDFTVVGIVVVGEHQREYEGMKCTTLHPCRECRNRLSPEPGPPGSDRPGSSQTWPGMPIVTVSVPTEHPQHVSEHTLVEEIHTLAEIIDTHDKYYRDQGRDPTLDNFEGDPEK